MEGMFLINITPLTVHKTMGDYANFLMTQHILRHFRNRSEVHLLFDNTLCQQQSPKHFERQHRDSANHVSCDYHCTDFNEDLYIPPKWRSNVLNCRTCKRRLVCFLSTYILLNIKSRLNAGQKFITAGGFDGSDRDSAFFVTRGTQPACDNTLTCNADESDTRIWLHVMNSSGINKLVLSPDTDVYHIGLRIVSLSHVHVIVKLSPFNTVQHRYLDLRRLNHALSNDPDLASLCRSQIPAVIQKLFICPGCDFVSFFTGYGKATFLATLFQHCEFITSNGHPSQPGTLANDDPNSDGFLAFLRLIGCLYYNKHKSAFLPSFPTPITVFNSLSVIKHTAS